MHMILHNNGVGGDTGLLEAFVCISTVQDE